ncbi:MAG: Mur ligase family protein, partial [Phycisphaerae bacterium]
MGLGRFGGGVGLTRWLVRQGARVTVSDQADAESLGESIARLAGLDVAVHVGGHDERDFRQADLVVVNPAVPKDSPFLQVAREAGVALTTEMNLFFQRCAATIIGVTGTVGKSTTTAMIGLALSGADMGDGQAAAGGRRRTWVGGNIGRSLLEELERIEPGDRVVLELSSFQLEGLAELRCSPHIAVITSL